MARLRDDPDTLNALVATTADALGIDAAFVEKDFWVIEMLRAATKDVLVGAKDGQRLPVTAIFKGGTSLSRVYGLIERFSEDVDLLVAFPDADLSIGARDRVLKSIRDAVVAHLGVASIAMASTTGVKRNVHYPYPARYGSTAVSEGVLLEMGSRGGTYPTQRHDLRSLVANYAIGTIGDHEDAWEEFAAVPVSVLAPERTLLEKARVPPRRRIPLPRPGSADQVAARGTPPLRRSPAPGITGRHRCPYSVGPSRRRCTLGRH